MNIVTVYDAAPKVVSFGQLRNGQIGKIVNSNGHYDGTVVMRVADRLIKLSDGDFWMSENVNFQVEVFTAPVTITLAPQ